MSELMNLDQAIELLKKTVKDSHLKSQKHIDLTLVDAKERIHYEEALMVAKAHVAQGKLTQAQLNERLGLI